MTREAKSDRSAVLVFAIFATVATSAFTIQAYMTYGFGREVWKMPVEMSVGLVFALDVFALMFMVLTYLLRGTGWPRAVTTLFFFVAIGAQVWATEMFGAHRGWPLEVRSFSVIPALFLAASQEGVVLWRVNRHRAKGIDLAPIKAKVTTPREPQAKPVPAPRPAVAIAPKSQVKAIEPSKRRGISGRRGRPVDTEALAAHDAVARRSLAGERTADLAKEAGVSTKSVQNWVKDYQSRTPETPADLPVNAPEKPVNGHAFTPEEVQS